MLPRGGHGQGEGEQRRKQRKVRIWRRRLRNVHFRQDGCFDLLPGRVQPQDWCDEWHAIVYITLTGPLIGFIGCGKMAQALVKGMIQVRAACI